MDKELEEIIAFDDSLCEIFKSKQHYDVYVKRLLRIFQKKIETDKDIVECLDETIRYISINRNLFRSNEAQENYISDAKTFYTKKNHLSIGQALQRNLDVRRNIFDRYDWFFKERDLEPFLTEEYVLSGTYCVMQNDRYFEISVEKIEGDRVYADCIIMHEIKDEKIIKSIPLGQAEFRRDSSYFKGILFIANPHEKLPLISPKYEPVVVKDIA